MKWAFLRTGRRFRFTACPTTIATSALCVPLHPSFFRPNYRSGSMILLYKSVLQLGRPSIPSHYSVASETTEDNNLESCLLMSSCRWLLPIVARDLVATHKGWRRLEKKSVRYTTWNPERRGHIHVSQQYTFPMHSQSIGVSIDNSVCCKIDSCCCDIATIVPLDSPSEAGILGQRKCRPSGSCCCWLPPSFIQARNFAAFISSIPVSTLTRRLNL